MECLANSKSSYALFAAFLRAPLLAGSAAASSPPVVPPVAFLVALAQVFLAETVGLLGRGAGVVSGCWVGDGGWCEEAGGSGSGDWRWAGASGSPASWEAIRSARNKEGVYQPHPILQLAS